MASLQQQVAELALQLVHERELRYEHRLSTLEALMCQPSGQPRASQEVEMETLVGAPMDRLLQDDASSLWNCEHAHVRLH